MCKIEHPPAFSQTQMQLISLQLEDHRGSSATKHYAVGVIVDRPEAQLILVNTFINSVHVL